MKYRRSNSHYLKIEALAATLAALLTLSIPYLAPAQDRDPDRDHDRITRIEPGTQIAVRSNEPIDVERRDNRVYYGTVDQDVRGGNGRLAIPKGSQVEMIVRVAPDNDLVIDVESVTVEGQRYAISTDNNRQESQRDNSVVGQILGAIQGGQAKGQTVRIPRDAILNFRIVRPLVIGVADRGIDRDGHHYHDDRVDNEH